MFYDILVQKLSDVRITMDELILRRFQNKPTETKTHWTKKCHRWPADIISGSKNELTENVKILAKLHVKLQSML